MKYLIDEKLTSSTNVDVETGAGILNLDIDENNVVTVDMGKPVISALLVSPQGRGIAQVISENREFDYFSVSM
jgi:diaminopimelate epimerase